MIFSYLKLKFILNVFLNLKVVQFQKTKGLPIKALLLIHNAPSQPSEDELKSGQILTKYLPTNVTPLLQPMDQDDIRFTKLHFKYSLPSASKSKNKHNEGNFTVKDAVFNLLTAWNHLKSEIINNCWRDIFDEISPCFDDEDADIPLTVLKHQCNNIDERQECQSLDPLSSLAPQVSPFRLYAHIYN